MDLPKRYDPKNTEDKWYKFWLDKGFFKANPQSSRPHFSVMMPPPNITGILTMGHVLNNTIQDIIIRFKRMRGYEALWQPGIDHAGIATQNVVEKALAKEGKSRFDLGREKFLEIVWKWKKQYGEKILTQLRKLGVSCDWSRVKFTMDPDMSRAVMKAFVELYRAGLIYRGTRIINWCPRCGTALADDEVEYIEEKGELYYIKYPLVGEKGYVVVATTRPETYLGDTAVAVNPRDERYNKLIGKRVRLPLIDWTRKDLNGEDVSAEIPIIADERVEKEFGTGAVKVTPAHDPADFEIGMDAGLPQVVVMDEEAVLNDNAGPYKGLERYAARKKILEDLEKNGFIEKIEDYQHNVGTCYRCHTVIEPYISEQWFVKMKPLAELALKAVESGEIKLVPPYSEKIYRHWLENVKDWCISRQIWWGHRIPVYTCQDCGHIMVGEEKPQKCEKCDSTNIAQDEDVLDTWFSSWLWPFSTLGWPERTDFLEKFYPTDVLVTGWDILFFWVARMIMAGYFFMKEKPFSYVYLHGLLRDEKRRKLSKSLGNSPDPLDLIEKYGADGVRMGIMLITPEGQDIIFTEKRMELGRNFANKIWNASRLLFSHLREEEEFDKNIEPVRLEDRWILTKLNRSITEVSEALEKFDFNTAAWELYNFFWKNYCDWYLEAIKPRLRNDDKTALKTAFYVLDRFLRLLHPFMPFITEELWQRIPFSKETESIMVSTWPEPDDFTFEDEASDFEFLIELIKNIRELRHEIGFERKRKSVIAFKDVKDHFKTIVREHMDILDLLAQTDKVMDEAERGIPILAGEEHLIFVLQNEDELRRVVARFEKELQELEGLLDKLNKKLSNQDFLEKAPAHVVQSEKEKKQNYEEKIRKLREHLEGLT
ncbi:MAG: valine--tRNA ligase [Candidatus Hydrothermae bacterium]|nr:valine--tRNA ligase [Candidatus Hydrothermae bacterium]